MILVGGGGGGVFGRHVYFDVFWVVTRVNFGDKDEGERGNTVDNTQHATQDITLLPPEPVFKGVPWFSTRKGGHGDTEKHELGIAIAPGIRPMSPRAW